MNMKRFAAGVLAAATVFTASAATFEGGIPLLSQTALIAEAASWEPIDSLHVAVDGIIYFLNRPAKTATACGFYKGNVK